MEEERQVQCEDKAEYKRAYVTSQTQNKLNAVELCKQACRVKHTRDSSNECMTKPQWLRASATAVAPTRQTCRQ
jgi:hypothetical protein